MPKIPEITVDLRLPPEERWAELLMHYKDETRAVIETIQEEMNGWRRWKGGFLPAGE